MSILVLDTHALVWFLQKDARLTLPARQAILDSRFRKMIPFLVCCEIHYLHAKEKFPLSAIDVLEIIRQTGDFELASHTEDQVGHLKSELDIHDAVIVATACALQESGKNKVHIVSKDEKIRAHSPVPILWD